MYGATYVVTTSSICCRRSIKISLFLLLIHLHYTIWESVPESVECIISYFLFSLEEVGNFAWPWSASTGPALQGLKTSDDIELNQ